MPRRFTRNAWRESTNRQKKICKNGYLEMCGLRNYLGILHRTYFGAMKFKERLIFVTCLILIILPFLWLHIAEYQERQLEESERTIRLLKVEDKYDFNSMEHGHSLSKDSNVLKTQNKDNKVGENIQNGQKSNVDTGDLKSKNKRSTDEKRKPKDEDEDDEIEADDAWLAWKEMVNFRTLTPSTSEGVNTILDALTFKPVVAAGIGYKGTQLKATLLLEGKQKVVFKPMRYPRDFIIEGKPYDGYDRHNGEIAAFHLDRILGFNRAPPVAGRKINLEDDIEPIAERNLLKTFFKKDGNTCFYGVCLYCKKSEPACANKTIMEGSVTVWLPQEWALTKWRHPWQRTYRNGRKAKWEVDNNYCKKVVTKHPYDEGPRLLDIIDTAIFDFLIGNADRHHYEVLKKGDEQGVLVHLDNAKSFGNPNEDEITILAPLYQCCRVRRSTWDRLYEIANNESKKLSEMLKASTDLDALSPILTDAHLEAVDRRLSTVMNIGKKCIDKNGKTRVLKDDST